MQKYAVIRLKDARDFLSPDQKKQLYDILKTIDNGRNEKGRTEDIFFVLNMADTFARDAIESYIVAAQNDKSTLDNVGAKAALQAAQDIQYKGIMAGPARYPTLPQ